MKNINIGIGVTKKFLLGYKVFTNSKGFFVGWFGITWDIN